MKNLIPMLLFVVVLSSCKNQQKDNENQHDVTEFSRSTEKSEIEVSSQNKNYIHLDSTLSELIYQYSKEYPIKKVEDTSKYVLQSYYVSFFKVKSDTLLALCRQPFLMELFPTYAFEENETPKEHPEYVGMVEGADLPIFIFDSGEAGNRFYNNTPIIKKYPERFVTDEGKSHTPEIPPIYKYKVNKGDFKFLGKSESQWID
ncbi:hypothetical protein LV716_17355 [Flagellimonas sp. HMM57]|uniref:hypothetical protein n=1 Tax=unclassified Flagellimonas TaxID=2644544 RepID=UPI0013D27B0D|nr:MULTISPECIES: hypothetical protein [unclassified Flagellimonas]UII76010.1 hypothetical protein LV716_17355 [Flagellimonas sp. HMM57]